MQSKIHKWRPTGQQPILLMQVLLNVCKCTEVLNLCWGLVRMEKWCIKSCAFANSDIPHIPTLHNTLMSFLSCAFVTQWYKYACWVVSSTVSVLTAFPCVWTISDKINTVAEKKQHHSFMQPQQVLKWPFKIIFFLLLRFPRFSFYHAFKRKSIRKSYKSLRLIHCTEAAQRSLGGLGTMSASSSLTSPVCIRLLQW